MIKKIFKIILILAVAIPVAYIFTILFVPLWRFIENSFGIEAIGHSGPAEWCFYLIYFLIVSIAWVILFRMRIR